VRIVSLSLLVCVLIAASANAQESTPDKGGQESPSPRRAAVILDQESGVIRFIIDGREQAVLDADGLHVRGGIDYTGALTDGNRYSQPPASGDPDAP
jgi:hypothetical protein